MWVCVCVCVCVCVGASLADIADVEIEMINGHLRLAKVDTSQNGKGKTKDIKKGGERK